MHRHYEILPDTYLLCLCIAAPCLPAIAQNDPIELPDIGTVAGSTLTIDQELIYGDAYMRMLRNNQPVINDPVLNEYIDNLGHRLVASANDVKTPFTFFMIRDRNINAFAFLVVTSPCTLGCSFMRKVKVS